MSVNVFRPIEFYRPARITDIKYCAVLHWSYVGQCTVSKSISAYCDSCVHLLVEETDGSNLLGNVSALICSGGYWITDRPGSENTRYNAVIPFTDRLD